jgi:hypothetical protein
MTTDVRSDGGLHFSVLQAPFWTGTSGAAVIAQWSCQPSLEALFTLWIYLRQPDGATGIQPEQAINDALIQAGIGYYIGTYIDQGSAPFTVRMLIALNPKQVMDEAGLNAALGTIAQKAPGFEQAGEALQHLRRVWASSQNQADDRMMMLSQYDLRTLLSDPARSPFTFFLVPPP